MDIIQHREEISTLKDQSAAQDEINKISQAQEKAFRNVEKAMASKEIQPGMTSKQVRSRYGEPSVTGSVETGSRWLYRSVKGSFIARPWIFLYFNPAGELARWECGHTAACRDSL